MGEGKAVLGGMSAMLKIHALSVLDGMLAICAAPGRSGDYQADLNDIHVWRPSLVVSLITPDERAAMGCPNLGSDIQSLGSRWIDLPVRDFSAPSPRVDALWDGASQQLRQALSGGGRVLIHCGAGCGRSGMAALRLMIECGEVPEYALKRLRSLRPCAVETGQQLQWAYAGAKKPHTL